MSVLHDKNIYLSDEWWIEYEKVFGKKDVINKLDGYDPNTPIEYLDQYQSLSTGTAIYPGKKTSLGLLYTALGISGEGGEFSDHVKKALRDDNFGSYDIFTDQHTPLTKERHELIVKELGDILWYVCAAANELGCSLSEIASTNLRKLYDRGNRGALQGSGDNR